MRRAVRGRGRHRPAPPRRGSAGSFRPPRRSPLRSLAGCAGCSSTAHVERACGCAALRGEKCRLGGEGGGGISGVCVSETTSGGAGLAVRKAQFINFALPRQGTRHHVNSRSLRTKPERASDWELHPFAYLLSSPASDHSSLPHGLHTVCSAWCPTERSL